MRIFICLILFLIIENVNAQQVSFRSDTVIDLHSHISRYDINGVCLLNDSIVLIFQKDEYKNREALVEKTGIFEITLYNINTKKTYTKYLDFGLDTPESFSLPRRSVVCDKGRICLFNGHRLLFFKDILNLDTLKSYYSVKFEDQYPSDEWPYLLELYNSVLYYSFYGAKAIYTFNLSNKKFGLYTELKTKSGINQTFDFRYVIKHNEFLAVADPFKLKVDIYKHGKFKTTLYVDSLLHDSVNVTKENFINAFMNKSKISTMGFFGFNTIFVNCLMKEPDHYEKAYNFFIDLKPRKPRIFSCVLNYVDTKLFDKNPACYKQPTFFENFISKGSHFYTFTAEYMENSCTKTWLECYNSRLIDELTVEEYEIIYH